MRKWLDARADETLHMTRGQNEVANLHQRLSIEDRALARGSEEESAEVGKFLNRNRAGMLAQFGHLGSRAQTVADSIGIDSGAQMRQDLARGPRRRHRHDEGHHLIELQRFEVAVS